MPHLYKIMHLFFLPDFARGRGLRTALMENEVSSVVITVSRQPATSANEALSYEVVGRAVTYRMASSKTLFRLRWVRAEHSRYLCARISLATANACSYETGSIFRARRASVVARSSRRSSLVPTRIMGTLGAWCSISGNHCKQDKLVVRFIGRSTSSGSCRSRSQALRRLKQRRGE